MELPLDMLTPGLLGSTDPTVLSQRPLTGLEWMRKFSSLSISHSMTNIVFSYPYFQDTEANGVSLGKSLFNSALAATQSATGKTVWVTETGWPVTGATAGDGIPSADNAKIYWDDVGCPNFGKINMYWYTLQDQNAASSVTPSFGIVGSTLSTTPLFDLSCSNTTSSSSSTASSKATSGVAALATGGSVASSGSGLSPTGMGAGISAVSGAASPTGTGSANGSPAGGSSNGTYTASTLKSASGSSATGSSTSGSGSSGSSGSSSGSASGSSSSSPSESTGGAASLTGSVALALGAVFAVAAAL